MVHYPRRAEFEERRLESRKLLATAWGVEPGLLLREMAALLEEPLRAQLVEWPGEEGDVHRTGVRCTVRHHCLDSPNCRLQSTTKISINITLIIEELTPLNRNSKYL